jgi:hypothetical protein
VSTWLAAQVAPGGSHTTGTAGTPGTGCGSTPAVESGADRQLSGSGNHLGESAGTRESTLLARAWAAVHAGTLSREPSRRDVQRVLKVRAQDAGWVAKAIKDHDGEGGPVPARL